MHGRTTLAVLLFGGMAAMIAQGDEGMWLLNEPPIASLKARHNMELSPAWLHHARLSSIRFNNGGSGSFVSPQGLAITNHHIGADALQKLSTPERNLLRDGFLAKTMADELKCPDCELNVLQEIIDVTAEVNSAVKPEMKPAEATAARRGVMSEIEAESLKKTGLRSDIVTLYQGGAYHLYRYQKFTDVRLVFAPESAIASFGGDVDNFEFPRFNLDICFFRVYQNDKPYQPEHWLKWSASGAVEGDLVFVTGHPGVTNRAETLAKLKHRRDHSHPYTLARLRIMEAALLQFGNRGPEQSRLAATDLHRIANARKAFAGQYQGLLDPALITRKRILEQEFLESLEKADTPVNREAIQGFKTIEQAQGQLEQFETRLMLWERGDALSSELFGIARHLVRLADESQKKNADRLREYRLSNLDSLKQQLLSPAPISKELERVRLTASLTFAAEKLGGDDPLLRRVFADHSPTHQIDEWLSATNLADVGERQKLLEGGATAIDSSRDPLIRLAKLIDPESRKLRQRFEEQVEEPERQAYSSIAHARFALIGRTVAPDATFTLRLAFGVVKGYKAEGENIPPQTTFANLFPRATERQYREPFDLPERWKRSQNKLDGTVPFNFVSTADTIGGNSGSPVLNRSGEFVGINFDRNRFGLVRNFLYTDEQARHIAVHSRGIIEALRLIYEAKELLKELGQ